jgi:hypothetical protein
MFNKGARKTRRSHWVTDIKDHRGTDRAGRTETARRVATPLGIGQDPNVGLLRVNYVTSAVVTARVSPGAGRSYRPGNSSSSDRWIGCAGVQEAGPDPLRGVCIAVGEQVTSAEALCVCGHPFRAHEHLRHGTDCTLCGPERCPRFRRRRWWRRTGRAVLTGATVPALTSGGVILGGDAGHPRRVKHLLDL